MSYVGEVRAFVFSGDVPAEVLADRSRPEWSRLVHESISSNLVTYAGLRSMTQLIVQNSTLLAMAIGLSTSAITPTALDLSLPTEKSRQGLILVASTSNYYQRYVAYFPTTAFSSTAIMSEALYDGFSTAANMWAEASVTISKTTSQSLYIEHRIQATT